MEKEIAVIGAGAWGTALAVAFSKENKSVFLWGRNEKVIQDIQTYHENKKYLPGITIDHKIRAITDIKEIKDVGTYVLATPAQETREVLKKFKGFLDKKEANLILTSKGIEEKTGFLMTQVAEEIFPQKTRNTAVLSGPSYAHEVALGLPTALTLGGVDEGALKKMQEKISHATLRIYRTLDPIGVQIGGALKNVLAIASGIVMGKELGENARAALVTRGLSEMVQLGKTLGAKPETFYGLSGLGDLLLTAMSPTSRNTSFGIELGQGKTKEQILKSRSSVIEGVFTAESLQVLMKKKKVEMPIATAVFSIIEGICSIEEVITTLLNRPLKEEI